MKLFNLFMLSGLIFNPWTISVSRASEKFTTPCPQYSNQVVWCLSRDAQNDPQKDQPLEFTEVRLCNNQDATYQINMISMNRGIEVGGEWPATRDSYTSFVIDFARLGYKNITGRLIFDIPSFRSLLQITDHGKKINEVLQCHEISYRIGGGVLD